VPAAPAPLRPWFPGGNGTTNLTEALDSLMWIIQVDYEYFGQALVIRGYIIPPEGAVTEGQILDGFADRLEEILDILDQAGVELSAPPEVQLSNDGNGLKMQARFEAWDYRA
jgi:hypothetical protein